MYPSELSRTYSHQGRVSFDDSVGSVLFSGVLPGLSIVEKSPITCCSDLASTTLRSSGKKKSSNDDAYLWY